MTLSDHVTASRAANSFSHGLVFSAEPLQSEEVFEVRIQKVHPHFAGSIRIGLTNLNVNGTHVRDHVFGRAAVVLSLDLSIHL